MGACSLYSRAVVSFALRSIHTSSFSTYPQTLLRAPLLPKTPRYFSNDNNNNSNMEKDKKDDATSVVERKKAVRKQVRARLKEVDQDTIASESQKVWDRLFALPQYQSAKSVGLFLSMPKGEIDTDPALKHAMEHNKTIYVPEVGKNFELADMELLQVVVSEKDDKEELFHKKWPQNKWGIPEPPSDMPVIAAKPGDIDVLVVPGLAFDRNGDRCGQGKGYYDRFIQRMCSDEDQKAPFLVAVGLQVQLVDENIPVAQYDRRMDMVLLPEEEIVVSKKRKRDE